uniref:HTH_Tnp_Tc3_1 domain-containing protein n=1 Tax=Heterorhabditis bacteriophora TaxID=37862 RepID=A0A1I7X986_HETBA
MVKKRILRDSKKSMRKMASNLNISPAPMRRIRTHVRSKRNQQEIDGEIRHFQQFLPQLNGSLSIAKNIKLFLDYVAHRMA